MLFKQLQFFNISENLPMKASSLLPKLESLRFSPCLPSFATSCGFIPPLQDEHAPLLHSVGNYQVFCVQFEDKILPATVVRDAVEEKVKRIEQEENRKVYYKEKRNIKEEMTQTLLPKAFSKKALVFGYIDPEHQLLIINTSQKERVKTFLSLLKKSLNLDASALKLKKVSTVLTQWIKNGKWPNGLNILDKSTLQDPNQVNRIIRSQAQDQFASSMQGFIKEGFAVKQLAVAWQDAIEFTITENLSLTSIRYREELLSTAEEEEIEDAVQRFDSSFFLMAKTLSELLPTLIEEFISEENTFVEKPAERAATTA